MKKNKESKRKIRLARFDAIYYIVACLIAFLLLIGIIYVRVENDNLRKEVEFNPVKEGLCVYVEYMNISINGIPVPDYILVYDYDIDKVIEIDMFYELVHTQIRTGDTILYCVDYNYTDADFLNVIKE